MRAWMSLTVAVSLSAAGCTLHGEGPKATADPAHELLQLSREVREQQVEAVRSGRPATEGHERWYAAVRATRLRELSALCHLYPELDVDDKREVLTILPPTEQYYCALRVWKSAAESDDVRLRRMAAGTLWVFGDNMRSVELLNQRRLDSDETVQWAVERSKKLLVEFYPSVMDEGNDASSDKNEH